MRVVDAKPLTFPLLIYGLIDHSENLNYTLAIPCSPDESLILSMALNCLPRHCECETGVRGGPGAEETAVLPVRWLLN